MISTLIKIVPLSVAMIDGLWNYIVGAPPITLQILVLFMILDVVTGVLKATKKRTLRSVIMTIGLRKKTAIMIAIIVAFLLDWLLLGGESLPFTMLALLRAIGIESLSVVENLYECGVDIPDVIMDKILILRNSGDHEDEDIFIEYEQLQFDFEDGIKELDKKFIKNNKEEDIND